MSGCADGESGVYSGISSCVDSRILGYKQFDSHALPLPIDERLNGHGLPSSMSRDGIQPCNLHQIVNLIREVTTSVLLLLHRTLVKATDQMAQA